MGSWRKGSHELKKFRERVGWDPGASGPAGQQTLWHADEHHSSFCPDFLLDSVTPIELQLSPRTSGPFCAGSNGQEVKLPS